MGRREPEQERSRLGSPPTPRELEVHEALHASLRAAPEVRHGLCAHETVSAPRLVASRLETSRRRDVLSFSHHQEVAALPPEEQDRWLGRLTEFEPPQLDQGLLNRSGHALVQLVQ